jgi:hypothetical protein
MVMIELDGMGVPFGNSSLLLGVGVARHGGLL